MFKRILMLLVVMLLLIAVIPASAQSDSAGWTAWLYQPEEGTVMLINSDGNIVRELQLPLAQGFDTFHFTIAVSPSGTHVAYIASDTSTDRPNQQLFIYDVALQSIVASHAIHPDVPASSLDFGDNDVMFNEAESRLAFGTVIFGEAVIGWEIAIIDYRVGDVVTTLRHTDAAAEFIGRDLSVPVIHRFEGDEVTFMTVFYATEGQPDYPTFTWNIESNAVRQEAANRSLSGDVLHTTGEEIIPVSDERFPIAEIPDDVPMMPPAPINAVQVYDPDTGVRFPFFTTPDYFITQLRFIQDGERILVRASDPVGESTVWMVVERDGTVLTSFPASLSGYRVFGTSDGFVYLDNDGQPQLVHVRTVDDTFEAHTLWTGQAGTSPMLAFVQQEATTPLEDFIPWAQLVEPTGE